jgi:hypothetical protein
MEWVSTALAVIGALTTWWKHTQLTGARKTLGGIAEAVEVVSATPQGQAVEQKLKSAIEARINQKDPSGGLGKLFDGIVQTVVPHVQAEMNALSNSPPAPAAPSPSPAPQPTISGVPLPPNLP